MFIDSRTKFLREGDLNVWVSVFLVCVVGRGEFCRKKYWFVTDGPTVLTYWHVVKIANP